MNTRRSIAIVQYAGDYAEAYSRLANGGPETYYAQNYSIETVGALTQGDRQVMTICCTGSETTDEVLSNGVRAVALASAGRVDEHRVVKLLEASNVTHLCLRTPLTDVLRHALDRRTVESVLLTLADSFNGSGPRARLWHWRLAKALNHPKVAAVGNHGLPSCRSLERIGVDPSRIVPWDWPHEITPLARDPKRAPPKDQRWRLLFVGVLSDSKGLGDCLEAVSRLRARGIAVDFEYAGAGDHEAYERRAATLGIESAVRYLGKIPHSDVVPKMRAADLVIVPSRHDYSEGFPMTIYEALSSRTPIVASDHPMYAGQLSTSAAASIYRAGDSSALADAVAGLMADPELYASLSVASRPAWESLALPVTWGDLLHDWAENSPARPLRNLRHALAAAGTA